MQTPQKLTHLTGLILAGGKSSRMGSDKAFVAGPEGDALVLHQQRRLCAVPVDELLLSGRTGLRYPNEGVRIVLDEEPDRGPLGGICAALNAGPIGHMLVLAVDLPNIEVSTLRRLAKLSTADCGCVPVSHIGFEPLCAVYPVNPYTRLQFMEALHAGRLSLQALLRDAVRTGWMRTTEVSSRQLENWNTPEDIKRSV